MIHPGKTKLYWGWNEKLSFVEHGTSFSPRRRRTCYTYEPPYWTQASGAFSPTVREIELKKSTGCITSKIRRFLRHSQAMWPIVQLLVQKQDNPPGQHSSPGAKGLNLTLSTNTFSSDHHCSLRPFFNFQAGIILGGTLEWTWAKTKSHVLVQACIIWLPVSAEIVNFRLLKPTENVLQVAWKNVIFFPSFF